MTIPEIKTFQKKHGLVVDGIAGPQTRRVLAEVARPSSTSARKEPDKTAINVPLVPATPVTTKPSLAAFSPISIPDTARKITEIILHCAATPEGKEFDRSDINAWHKQRGWDMIGYHFVVKLDGTIQIGRPIGMTGIHTKGRNTGTIGICYIGGLTADGKSPKDSRTTKQRAALFWLVKTLKARFNMQGRARGHNEFAKKACPSFDVAADFLGTI